MILEDVENLPAKQKERDELIQQLADAFVALTSIKMEIEEYDRGDGELKELLKQCLDALILVCGLNGRLVNEFGMNLTVINAEIVELINDWNKFDGTKIEG